MKKPYKLNVSSYNQYTMVPPYRKATVIAEDHDVYVLYLMECPYLPWDDMEYVVNSREKYNNLQSAVAAADLFLESK